MSSMDSFQQAEDRYFVLRGQLETGKLTREQFEAELKKLMVEDAQGRYWVIGPDTGKWFVHDGATWVESTPPSAAQMPPPPPRASYTPPPPPSYTPAPYPPTPMVPVAPPPSSANTMLFAIGGVAIILLLGAIGFFFATSQGVVKLGQAAPTSTIAITPIIPTPVVLIATNPPPTLTPLPTTTPTVQLSPTPTVTPTLAADQLVRQADNLVLQSKFDEAAALYQQAATGNPPSAIAFAHWARLLDWQAYLEMRNDLYTMAVVKAESAQQFGPNEPEAFIWLARAYDWNGLYDKAIGFSQKAIQLAPNSATAYAIQAEVELDLNKLDDAERDAQKALQLDPNSTEGHRILGYVLQEKKQSSSSINPEFEKNAQLEPNFAVRLYELGYIYLSGNNFALTVPQLQRSIALYPRPVRAYFALGAAYRDQKQYDKAIESFNAAIKLNDQVASLYLGLGQSYLGAGNLPAAKDAAQKASTLDPNNQTVKNLVSQIAAASASPTPSRPPATATRVPPTATATPIPPTATPALPPAVYVKDVRVDPTQVRTNQFPTFQVTFINSNPIPIDSTWFIQIYNPDNLRSSFGQTSKSKVLIPLGESTFASVNNWKASGSAQCRQFVARVWYQEADASLHEFSKVGGDTFQFYFTVCD